MGGSEGDSLRKRFGIILANFISKNYTTTTVLVSSLGFIFPFLFVISLPFLSKSRFEVLADIFAVALISVLLGAIFTVCSLYILTLPVSSCLKVLYEYLTYGEVPKFYEIYCLNNKVDKENTLDGSLILSLLVTDYLTGVYNRRSAEVCLKKCVNSEQTPLLSLAMLDVDNLRFINNEYGHSVGDICLRYVANVLKENIVGMDKNSWVGRWGGDEFLVMLCGLKEKESFEVMRRICSFFDENPVCVGNQLIGVSLSIGICEYDPKKDNEKNLLVKTDRALLEAKKRGKGQIICYSSLLPI